VEELDRLLDGLLAEGPTVDELLALMPSVDMLLVELGPSDEEWAELIASLSNVDKELDKVLAELDHGPVGWGID